MAAEARLKDAFHSSNVGGVVPLSPRGNFGVIKSFGKSNPSLMVLIAAFSFSDELIGWVAHIAV
jgi:hypothetical protein